MMCRSVPQTPTARGATTISPAAGAGSGTSSTDIFPG
jgi:hypothetical protein